MAKKAKPNSFPDQAYADTVGALHVEWDTLIRLTGIFYAPGVKANVLFFERKPDRPSCVSRICQGYHYGVIRRECASPSSGRKIEQS